MYSETITLFNRYHSRLGDMWYPHILHNVDFVSDKSAAMAKYGAESTDKASLHVKYQKVGDSLLIEGMPYIPAKEWSGLTNDELAEHITFNSDANYFDFFIQGEYEGTEPISDDAFVDGFFAHMEDETECFAITSVSTPYKLIPHFNIMAR